MKIKSIIYSLLVIASLAFLYFYFISYKIKEEKQIQIKETLKQEDKKNMEFTHLPSGLKYKTLEAGSGNQTPNPGQTANVNYAGYLAEEGDNLGKKFDSGNFSFVAGTGQVIKGFDEGVLSMVKGEKRRLVIPANIGYGARGVPGAIPGNATLIFDIELVDFK